METFLIAARAVHYASTISLAGVFAFLCFVASAEALPRLRRQLWLLAWAGFALMLLSGGAWLLFLSAQMSGQPIAAALTQGIVATVLTSTRFGQIWILRFVLSVILAVLLLMPQGWRRWFWCWGGLAFAAGLLAALAWAGHGGATPGRPGELHLTADMLHLLAAGAWVGSLLPLALLLAEIRRSGNPDAAAARRAVVRFSILAAISVVILLTAGLVNTWFLAGTVPALIGTGYGRLLLAKIAIFATMVMIAAVNLLRMTPRLAWPSVEGRPRIRNALGHLRRNALVEAGLGFCVLGIVAILGVLPPGLHTEPGWPLPFRLELGALAAPSRMLLAILTALAAFLAIIGVATAAAGHYRAMIAAWGGLATCVVLGAFIVRPAVEPAYPTSFYAPAEPYAASSIVHGGRLYTENCALCHGVDGRGDGPASAGLTVRPADLTAPHLFAHSPGDLFWWVSNGRNKGVMPGFAGIDEPGRPMGRDQFHPRPRLRHPVPPGRITGLDHRHFHDSRFRLRITRSSENLEWRSRDRTGTTGAVQPPSARGTLGAARGGAEANRCQPSHPGHRFGSCLGASRNGNPGAARRRLGRCRGHSDAVPCRR